MLTEVVLLKFIFWEIWCHTGYPTESLDVSTRKMDVDFPFCLLRGKVRGKKIPLVMGCYPKNVFAFLCISILGSTHGSLHPCLKILTDLAVRGFLLPS